MMRLPYALGAAILTNILEYPIVRENFQVGSLILSGLTNHFSKSKARSGAEEPNFGANLKFERDTFQS
jgi:hypothetical protein